MIDLDEWRKEIEEEFLSGLSDYLIGGTSIDYISEFKRVSKKKQDLMIRSVRKKYAGQFFENLKARLEYGKE